jgi:hypothetical protein
MSTAHATFTVPQLEDLAEGIDRMDRTLAALLRGSDWVKAATIAAHVELGAEADSNGDAAVVVRGSRPLSARGFAALGINGLRNERTVRRYWHRWADTGRPRPAPGEAIDLDSLPPWEQWSDSTSTAARKGRSVSFTAWDRDSAEPCPTCGCTVRRHRSRRAQ